MLHILAHEFRKLLFSLRLQILMALGALLFLLAAWSAVARHQLKQEAFADLVHLEQERFERVRSENAWSDFVVQVAPPPRPTALLYDGKSDYLPNVFGFNAKVPQRIHYSSNLGYNFAIPKFNRLDWTFIVSYLFTFGALVLSFDAVAAEREQGTLRLLGSYSVARHKILLAKHLATVTALLAAVGTGAISSFALFSLLAPGEFAPGDVQLFAIWLIGVALTLSLYAAIGLLLSVCCRRSSQSLHAAIALWITLVVGVPSVAQLVARSIHPTRTATEVAQQVAFKTTGTLPRDRIRMPTAEERAARSREIAELYNSQLRSNLDQALLANRLSKLSPDSILDDSLSRAFRTGIYGLEEFATETALEASSFSDELRRDPAGVEHPILRLADRWRHSDPPPPPWHDWGILLSFNALILTGAGLVFEKSDLL